MNSFLFRDATIVDGTGSPRWQGDLAVSGGAIAALAPALDHGAAEVVDATGLVLAPGFIDIHGHSDMTIFRWPLMESKAFQGVATEVVGNCGLGLFPAADGGADVLAEYLGLHDFHLPSDGIRWRDMDGFHRRVAGAPTTLNLAPLVGHAPLRLAVMGMTSRPPSESETFRMQSFLNDCLTQGAWGLSTGLIYPPGSYADTGEIVDLARTVAFHRGLYASHVRGEGEQVFEALREAVEIGRRSGVRVQVSHLKVMGRQNRGKAKELLEMLQEARHQGIDAAADQYPYTASATTLAAVVPAWAHDGGIGQLLGRLGDPRLKDRLVTEIDSAIAAREGAEGIVVTGCSTPLNRELAGQNVASIAAKRNISPAEAVIQLLQEEEGRLGAIFFSMGEADVETILRDPLVAVGSDGHAMNAEEAAGEPTHPRSYGTFPQVLGHYVREKQALSLEEAVRKMTALPASRMGFTRRGLLQPGFAADLVLFDPQRIRQEADLANPHRYSTGIEFLLVDGVPVIRDGRLTGNRPGRVLLRSIE